ncbi:hypothetical protein [Paenibacillus illinoisensis]|uniref:hypothetical protein n=1 Tax=Paenibacillus illinoisensis TaxID=59845 RepID=UPI00301E565E
MQQKKAFSPQKGRKDRGTTLVRHPVLTGPSGLQHVCLTLYGITTVNRLPLLLSLSNCCQVKFREPLRSEFRQPCSTETLSIYGASSLSRGTAYLSPSSRLLMSQTYIDVFIDDRS